MSIPPGSHEPKLRFLSLDGGGVRGLASLYILDRFLMTVGNPRPCYYFDMIAGTSTGGLIAIMLGRLEMSVKDCIELYTVIMDDVFPKKPYQELRQGAKMLFKRTIQPRYSSEGLRRQIEKVIEISGLPSTALMRPSPAAPKSSSCKTLIVATAEKATGTFVHFTDYEREAVAEGNFYSKVTILDAALATCAATNFFNPHKIKIEGMTVSFIDAGLGCNNPIDELWNDALQLFGRPLEHQVRCLLSIGTTRRKQGNFGKRLSEVARSIIGIATEADATARRFSNSHEDLGKRGAYYRLAPEDLDMRLDAPEEKETIMVRVGGWFDQNDYLKGYLNTFKRMSGYELNSISLSIIQTTEEANHVVYPIEDCDYLSPPILRWFYKLDRNREYIDESNKEYWHHLTSLSYTVYEQVYNDSRDQNNQVSLRSFQRQFSNLIPSTPLQKVERAWLRLQDRRHITYVNESYPKPFVLAVLYMLHLERFSLGQPLDKQGHYGIDPGRRDWLERWAKWVPCECSRNCGLLWNFAVIKGMYKPADKRSCDLKARKGGKKSRQLDKVYESTYRSWRLPTGTDVN